MIRRISCVVFLLLYLTTTAGFALNIHYCGSTVASVKIDQKTEKNAAGKLHPSPINAVKTNTLMLK